MSKQIKWILSLAIVFVSFSSCKETKKIEDKAIAERPNILYIMADDHTSQAWGIYGGILKDYVHTPNISRWAEG